MKDLVSIIIPVYNAERFIDETKGGLTLGNAILDQEGGAFYIYDQDLYEKSYRLRKHNDLGYHVQADTLEELAEKLGINAENLVKTVETTNKAVDHTMVLDLKLVFI